MNTKYSQTICLILSFILIIISCNSCAIKAYACEIIDSESFEDTLDVAAVQLQTVTLGQSTFEVSPSVSVKSMLNNEVYSVYTIKSDSNVTSQNIKINATTGEMVGFNGIKPFPKIDRIEFLSDEDLKKIVERLFNDSVDFSIYNTFKAERPVSSSGKYHLLWQVQKDLLCNTKIEVYITSDGFINNYAKIDACPSDLTTSFITSNERDSLIEARLCEHLGIESTAGISYEILSETLSLYNNENSIIYVIKVIEDGFSQVIVLAIS